MQLAMKSLLLLPLIAFCYASPGDKLDEFDDCIHQCQQTSCYKNPYYIMQEQYREELEKINFRFRRFEPSWQFDEKLSLHLKLLLWDCQSNCDYQCQRIITNERKLRGEQVYQFHGKWPFRRVLGIQELFSALFSMVNFIPHYIGYRKVKQAMRTSRHGKTVLKPMLRHIKLVAFVTMCAWVCSTAFHIRDFNFTEKLDYYFAGLTVFTGFYAIGYRCLRLYSPSRNALAWLWSIFCLAAYSAHFYRLVNAWLYAYNMRANILVGALQNIFWGLTCFSLYTKYYEREVGADQMIHLTHLNYIQLYRIFLPSFFAKSAKLYSLYPLLLCGIVISGMSLEIFDFPPLFSDLIDAHSLWHLVTVFPALLGWYDWMLWDVNENVWDDLKTLNQKKYE